MDKYSQTKLVRQLGLVAGAAALALGVAAGAADRDPAYAAARAAKKVGEQVDGYLGIAGEATADLRRLVEDINIKRKAVYAERAKEQHATIEDYAFTSGCVLITQTKPNEVYQAPDGTWKTRTTAPPIRDPRCP